MHGVKLRRSGGGNCSVTIPREVRELASLAVGDGWIGVRAIGPCVVLCRITHATPGEALAEADAAIAALLRETTIVPPPAKPGAPGYSRG